MRTRRPSQVDLVGKEVQFSPEIYSTADGSGVRDVVNKWIDHFINVGTLFRRLDKGSNGLGTEEYVKVGQYCGNIYVDA